MVHGKFLAHVAVILAGFVLIFQLSEVCASEKLPYVELFDNETGVMIYLGAGSISAVAVAKPSVSPEELWNKKLEKGLNKVERYIDQKHGVALYYYCATPRFDPYGLILCDSSAVQLERKKK